MAGADPEEHVHVPVLRQRWEAASFLHWRYPAAVVRALLPDGLVAEELDGSAWIGMVCFLANGSAILGRLGFPGGRDFPETNVRTYVRTPNGDDAVWFLTLEVGNPMMARAGRALRLPYRSASMSVVHDGDEWVYESRRGDLGHRVVVRPTATLDASARPSRDRSLTGRWRAAIPLAPRRLVVPVEHEPWPLREATLVELDERLLESLGLPAPSAPPEVRFSDGVRAVIGLPRPRWRPRARPSADEPAR